MSSETKIPKIIHQLWIGNQSLKPANLMKTWADKHPDYEYIFWNEKEIVRRDMKFMSIGKIKNMTEICGKADIIRWEILYKYGGVFIDADSICIESLNDEMLKDIGFAGYENEELKGNLVSNGTMGFVPNHQLCLDAIRWIISNDINDTKAWISTGPRLLTNLIESGKYPGIKIYPSYYFLPIHHSGKAYTGHRKVFAHQAWGSTNKNYRGMNSMELPQICKEPTSYISLLVSNNNADIKGVEASLNSFLDQPGYFGIELVYINNGSDKEYTEALEKLLDEVKAASRFFRLIYKKFDTFVEDVVPIGKTICTTNVIMEIEPNTIIPENGISIELGKISKMNKFSRLGGMAPPVHSFVSSSEPTIVAPQKQINIVRQIRRNKRFR